VCPDGAGDLGDAPGSSDVGDAPGSSDVGHASGPGDSRRTVVNAVTGTHGSTRPIAAAAITVPPPVRT
jgi:hypothetical protein